MERALTSPEEMNEYLAMRHAEEIIDDIKAMVAEGETLRDRFAMAALTGYLSCPVTGGDQAVFAKVSYEIADVMLKARGI